MRYVFLQVDPTLERKRRELIESAAFALDKARMVRFSPRTGDLNATGNEGMVVIYCS
jgi:activating signal cointegrator complex subunit 3